MVTQNIFGERLEVLEEQNLWSKVKNVFDHYEGWCLQSHLLPFTLRNTKSTPLFTADWVNTVKWNGEPMRIPFGCDLSFFSDWNQEGTEINFEYQGNYLKSDHANALPDRVLFLSTIFLNTAYLWGGKSIFGIDCSGLTQNVFRLAGLSLPRDAYQQAEKGHPVTSLEEAKKGDLVFFDNEEGRITHVGIFQGNGSIIHASGRVRIDTIDQQGIVQKSGLRTHHLCSIRRYF